MSYPRLNCKNHIRFFFFGSIVIRSCKITSKKVYTRYLKRKFPFKVVIKETQCRIYHEVYSFHHITCNAFFFVLLYNDSPSQKKLKILTKKNGITYLRKLFGFFTDTEECVDWQANEIKVGKQGISVAQSRGPCPSL